MKKQKIREEKGITLVALVVTIIVLIILAGVTLNIVLDQDGIINKAQQAVGDYENAKKEEEEILGQVENYLNPPIPEGYVASNVPGENIVATGLVIYEGDDPVTEENHEDAMKNRNQYVWIPVTDINSMVMCSSNTGDSVCNLVLERDALKCTTHSETATELVGRLYIAEHESNIIGEDTIYSNNIDFTKKDQIYDTSSYHEPAIVTGEDGTSDDNVSSNLETAGMIVGSTAQDFLAQLKSDFTEMAISVAKNGGFYVSRFEIGINGESKKNQIVLSAADNNNQEENYNGANSWYGLYRTCRNQENKQQMIWGCQYDQIVKFIGDEARTGHNNRELTTSRALSGQNELDKMKNIYDLEGNFGEWTAETMSNIGRIHRACRYFNANEKDFFPVSFRPVIYFCRPSDTYNYDSTRSTLYV